MPNITDWLMVGITLVYVITTVFIWIANYNSVRVSREELAEIKKQYNELKRPHIEYEFCYKKRAWYIVRFVNHGRTTAQHVKIDIDDEFIDGISREEFKEILRSQRDKEFIIGAEQHYDLYISGNELRGNHALPALTGRITYSGNGIRYESDIFIDIKNYPPFFSSIGKSDSRITRELKELKNSVQGVENAIKKLEKDKGKDLYQSDRFKRSQIGYRKHRYTKF